VTVIGRRRLDHYENAALFVLLNHRQRASGRLEQRLQLRFDKPVLLVRIAHVAQRRTHVERAARLTLEKHIVTAQVNLGRLAGSSQLFQVTPTGFSLFVFLAANGLCVGDPLWDGNRFSCCHDCCALYLNPCYLCYLWASFKI
jgi:hypothetical protein